MRMIGKKVNTAVCLVLVGTGVFAQSLADAKKAIDAEQYQRGKSMLKVLTTTQLTNAENYFYLGNIYLKTDHVDSAKITFNKGIAANASYSLNYIGMGAVALAEGDTLAAKEQFNKAVSLVGKKDNSPWLNIAKAYTKAPKPDYGQALVYVEKAKEINDKDAQVYLAMGDAYRGQMRNSDAYSAYRTAFELNKTLLRSKVELGVINKMSKAFQESEDEFNSVLAIDPNYGPAYRELAETYYLWANSESSQYDARMKKALHYYEKYMDLTDRLLESRMRHADFLILAKEFKALEAEANEMAKIDRVNPRILRYQAYAAYENGNYTSSIQALKDFIAKVDPKRVIAQDYLYLGRAEIKNGAIENGINDIKRAIVLDSASVVAMSEIGKALYDSKKYTQAAQAYELSIKNPKRNLLDYYYLGSSYYFDYGARKAASEMLDNSLLVKADSAFSYLIQRSPSTHVAWQFRGRINRQLDDANDSKGLALSYYEKYVDIITVTKPDLAVKNAAGLIEAYTYLGSVAARKDRNNAKAKDYFDKVLVLDPNNEVVKQALKAISPGGK